MKTKFNKPIIITILSIIGIITLTNKNTEVPKNEITEKINALHFSKISER